jgi:hypothetical protein
VHDVVSRALSHPLESVMNCFGQGIWPEGLLEQCFADDVVLEPRHVGIAAAELHFQIGSSAPRQANGIHSRQAVHYQVGDHQIAGITALEDRQRSAPAVRLRNEVTDFAEILRDDPTDIRIVVCDAADRSAR